MKNGVDEEVKENGVEEAEEKERKRTERKGKIKK